MIEHKSVWFCEGKRRMRYKPCNLEDNDENE